MSVKISALTGEVTTPADDDVLVIVDDAAPGGTKRITVGNLRTALGGTASDAAPAELGAANPGDSGLYSRGNHVHAHGDQAGGTLHAAATGAVAGFMAPGDKSKLDGIAAGADVTADAGAVMDADFAGAHAGHLVRTNAGVYGVIKHNLSAAVAPTSSDDSSAGYAVGSLWIDTAAGVAYRCVDPSASAARWLRTLLPGDTTIRSTTGGSAELLDDDVAILQVDTSADGDSNVALPGGTGPRTWLVCKTSTDAAALTLQPAGSETIQGAAAGYELPGSRSGLHPAWLVCRDDAGAIWVVSITPPPRDPAEESGTARTLTAADDGSIIRCTAGTTVTITVPTGLRPGYHVRIVQAGVGQVQLAAGVDVTLFSVANVDPYTAEQWAHIDLTVLQSSPGGLDALVSGELAAAP